MKKPTYKELRFDRNGWRICAIIFLIFFLLMTFADILDSNRLQKENQALKDEIQNQKLPQIPLINATNNCTISINEISKQDVENNGFGSISITNGNIFLNPVFNETMVIP